MKSSIIKLLVSCKLVLFLSACVPYHHAYYPAGRAYSVTQGNYYGGYPYRYDNYSYPYNSNYHYDEHHHFDHHDDYNSHPSWNKGHARPNSPRDFKQNHPDRKYKQFGYQGSFPPYPDRKDHSDLHNNNNRSKPSFNRRWEHNNNNHYHQGRPTLDVQNYGQNHRSDDRRNQIKEQRHYDQGHDKHVRYGNHKQAKGQRISLLRDHYQ